MGRIATCQGSSGRERPGQTVRGDRMTRPASGCTHGEAPGDDHLTPPATPETAARIGATPRPVSSTAPQERTAPRAGEPPAGSGEAARERGVRVAECAWGLRERRCLPCGSEPRSRRRVIGTEIISKKAHTTLWKVLPKLTSRREQKSALIVSRRRLAGRRAAGPATGSHPPSRRGRSRSACVVNGRLRHMGEGAVRRAPSCVVSRV